MLVSHTQESLHRHEQLNAYEAQNGGTAVYGVNVFSDLTPEEFKSMLACIFRDLSHLTQEEYVRVKFFLIWLLHTCKWNRFTLRLKTLSCFTFWLASFPGSPHMGMFGLQATKLGGAWEL